MKTQYGNILTIDDIVFKVPDYFKIVERVVWDICFEYEWWLKSACQEFGWQGGTAYQVIDKIMEYKRK